MTDYREQSEAADIAAEQPKRADLDMKKIQASMQGIRDQQDRELREDLAKFENRPKPPWMQDPAAPAAAEHENPHWEDRGIIDVPVADLPQPEGVNGPQDFDHHITYPDAVAASRRLQEMKPQIDGGYKSDDFAALDRKNGLDYANGQQRINDLYYGSDPVTLDKDGDKYDIVGGRHRIFIAREAGYETIPARVREKVSG